MNRFPGPPAPPVAPARYLRGMSTYHEPRPLRTLPLYTASAEDAAKLFPNQRRVLERRAEYVRAQLVRDREAARGNPAEPELDPVLRFHLGLEKR
jgi:hypothetical protein